MRIDGYYNREPIGLSDNPEEATFSFAHVTIPLDASTCVTLALAGAAASVAKRFNTFLLR